MRHSLSQLRISPSKGHVKIVCAVIQQRRRVVSPLHQLEDGRPAAREGRWADANSSLVVCVKNT
jgi:hypothetical protein